MSEAEFVNLIDRNKHTIVAVCNKYCNKRTDYHADLMQEIILETWKSINNFKKSCTFKTWLYNIARNVCISFIRKQKNNICFEDVLDYAEVITIDAHDEELVKQLHDAARYDNMLDTIEQPYRDIFNAYVYGASFKELERRYEINGQALRVKIHRIKKKLRQTHATLN